MRLYYFTNSFPYGMGEEWKLQELEILADYFSEIKVVPYQYDGNKDNPRKLNALNIEVIPPLFQNDLHTFRWMDFFAILMANPVKVVKEFISRRVLLNKSRLHKALLFTSNSRRIVKNPNFQKLIRDSDSNTYWFFFWGRGLSDVLAFLPTFKRKKIGVRLHRYDIFEFASGDYIPFRDAVYAAADSLFSVSEYGRNYIKSKYPKMEHKVKVTRLGTLSNGRSKSGSDIFHIVSCSHIVAVKRVELIVSALAKIKDREILWTHIGSGPQLESIQHIIRTTVPANVQVTLKGYVPPSQVSSLLISQSVDLFLNVSSSEGVPVSIMEALAAGIPVMATDVGGTKELIDETVGELLPPDIDSSMLALKISSFADLSMSKRNELRNNAYARYEERCNMINCTKKFAKEFI